MKDTTTGAGKVANAMDFWMKPHTCFYHTTRSKNRNAFNDSFVPVASKKEDIVQSCQLLTTRCNRQVKLFIS